MIEFDYKLNFKKLDFTDFETRKLYRIGRGEQGVLLVRPYTNDICKFWKFKTTIINAKKLTERKRYYVSNYGIENFIDIVNGKTDKIIKAPNFDRYYDNELIEWWRKLATKRFYKLKEDGRLRKGLEIWTKDSEIDIIR